jgi:hypothetical protein
MIDPPFPIFSNAACDKKKVPVFSIVYLDSEQRIASRPRTVHSLLLILLITKGLVELTSPLRPLRSGS